MHTHWIGSNTMNTEMMISTDWSVQVTKNPANVNFCVTFEGFCNKGADAKATRTDTPTPLDGDVLMVCFPTGVPLHAASCIWPHPLPSALCVRSGGRRGMLREKPTAASPWFRQAAELVALRSKVNRRANRMAAAGVKSREELEAGEFQQISNQ